MDYTYIDRNVERIREKIELAAKASGRKAEDIVLLSAIKSAEADEVNYIHKSLGIHSVGENRVQQLLERYDKLDRDGLDLHFIGSLQTNKVKYIIDKVDMIHSVESLKLAQEIEKRAAQKDVVMDVLIEVNMGGEESKFGVAPEETEALLREISVMEHIRVRGLMTVAPFVEDQEENREVFRQMRELLVDMNSKKIDNIKMDTLSMGMTGDYEVAIEEGATIVRVGTGIFGERYYPNKG
jgi:pyridoxal phosphate enzyme (YggS family)